MQVRRRRDFDIGERVLEPRRGLPAAVRSLELIEQGERLVCRATFEEADRLLPDHVVGMALAPRHPALDQDRRIEIHALPGENGRVVVSHGRIVDMPFADDAGVIARGAEQVRPGRRII